MKIYVKAKPSSKNEKVEQMSENIFAVSVKEPPKEGAANRAIVRALAEYFGVAPSRVRMVSGFSSRQKMFEIL